MITVPLLAVRMSMNAEVMPITPPTLMFISAINPARSAAGALRFLWSMMPALFISTSSFGKSAFTRAARAAICAGSATSLWMVWSFGCFAFTSSSTAWRRPVTMTSFPSSTNLSAKARPMPAEPPVMRMVRPVRFIRFLSSLHSSYLANLFGPHESVFRSRMLYGIMNIIQTSQKKFKSWPKDNLGCWPTLSACRQAR